MVTIPHVPNPRKEQTYQAQGRRGRPMLFQITDPHNTPLFPYLLALHINPQNFEERMMTSKSVAVTRGGFVEWIWPDELDILSASASTGAFIGPDTGLVSGSDGRISSSTVGGYKATPGRHQTIAWERYQDLLELFHCNGMIFDGNGRPVIRGKVMCVYDRGVYLGHFTTFTVKESDEKAFSFELDWEFKVEASVYIFPSSQTKIENSASSLSGTVSPIANRVGLDTIDIKTEHEDMLARTADSRRRAAEERRRASIEEFGELAEDSKGDQWAADQLTDKERAKLPKFLSESLKPSRSTIPEDQFTADSIHFFDGERQDILDGAAQRLGHENWTDYVQAVGPENAAAAGLEAMAGFESQVAGTVVEANALQRAARERGYENWEAYEASVLPNVSRTIQILTIQDAYERAQQTLPSATFTADDISSMRAQGMSEQDILVLQQAAYETNNHTYVNRSPQPVNIGGNQTSEAAAIFQRRVRRQRSQSSEDVNQSVLTRNRRK